MRRGQDGVGPARGACCKHRGCGGGTRARHIPEIDEIIATIVREHRDGDVVVLMSNGGFGGIHKKLVQALAA